MSDELFYVITQIIGFIAMGLGIVSYQAKKNKIILIFQLVSAGFWVLQFALLGKWNGTFLNVISLIRCLVYAFNDKLKINRILIIIILNALITTATVFAIGNDGWIALLPGIAMIVTTIFYAFNDNLKLRISSFSTSPLWMIYDILVGSIAGTCTEIFVMCSVVVSLFRFHRKKKEKEIVNLENNYHNNQE